MAQINYPSYLNYIMTLTASGLTAAAGVLAFAVAVTGATVTMTTALVSPIVGGVVGFIAGHFAHRPQPSLPIRICDWVYNQFPGN